MSLCGKRNVKKQPLNIKKWMALELEAYKGSLP